MNKDSKIRLRTGNSIPVMGLGTWQLTRETAEAVSHAIELGYPMIDTSSDYGTQPGIGAALKRSGISSSDIYIVTKVEETDDSYRRSRSNLHELDLEYVDLMLIHRPPFTGAGEHLWDGLIRARDEGLTRDIGVSNYSSGLIDRLIEDSGEVPAVNQIEWSPFGHSQHMRRYCDSREIIIQSYSPLTRTKRLGDATLTSIAVKYGKSAAQILIRWNMQEGYVPIPKANQRQHLEENIDIFDFELSADDIEKLNGLNEHYSSLGFLPYV